MKIDVEMMTFSCVEALLHRGAKHTLPAFMSFEVGREDLRDGRMDEEFFARPRFSEVFFFLRSQSHVLSWDGFRFSKIEALVISVSP